jgi:hypothetical protein
MIIPAFNPPRDPFPRDSEVQDYVLTKRKKKKTLGMFSEKPTHLPKPKFTYHFQCFISKFQRSKVQEGVPTKRRKKEY